MTNHPPTAAAAQERLLANPTVSTEDAAVLLGISPQAVRIAQRHKELEGFRVGRSIRITSAPLIERLHLKESSQ